MITQFTIGFSRTINLGNFQSARVESSVTVDVSKDFIGQAEEDEVTMQMARAQAQVELRALLEDTYRAQHLERQTPK